MFWLEGYKLELSQVLFGHSFTHSFLVNKTDRLGTKL